MFQDFICCLKEEEKSYSTINKYARDVKEFMQGRHISELCKPDAIEHKQKIMLKYKPTTVNSKIISLNRYFRFEQRPDMLLKPIRIQKNIFIKSEQMLSKREYMTMLKNSEKDVRLNLILQTLASTGIRIGELKYITVEAARKQQTMVNNKGKWRTILLPTNLCVNMLIYASEHNIESGYIFRTRTGQPMNRSNIWKEMKRLAERSGISQEKVYPHNLRHLFAITYYEKEKDIAKLADLLGHSNLNTTRLYIVSDGKDHARQIDLLGLTT